MMKIILLLEPPYSMLSLELEDTAVPNGYYYFSLSDIFIDRPLPDEEDATSSAEKYQGALRKYLRKPPKNTPNGFILDSDCINSKSEFDLLLEVLHELEYELDLVVDILVDQENAYEDIPDFMEEEEAQEEMDAYFNELQPYVLSRCHQLGILVEHLDEEDSVGETQRNFIEWLRDTI